MVGFFEIKNSRALLLGFLRVDERDERNYLISNIYVDGKSKEYPIQITSEEALGYFKREKGAYLDLAKKVVNNLKENYPSTKGLICKLCLLTNPDSN